MKTVFKSIVICPVLYAFCIQFCWSTTFYVDSISGNDSNTGTSEKTCWKTIEKINNIKYQPGDFILFKRGGKWRAELSVSSSGAKDNPITYSSYGIGDDPIITGTDKITGWSIYSGNVYRALLPTECYVVFSNGIKLKRGEGNFNTLINNEWCWNNNYLYVNINGANPDELILEASQRDNGIHLPNKKNIIIEGIYIYGVNNHGIDIGGVENGNITVKNCIIKNVGYAGIKAINSSYILISNNIISQISLREAVYNTQGISLESSFGNTISGKVLDNNISYVYGETGQGITLGGNGRLEDVIISGNQIMHAYDDGIKTYMGNNIIIENNVVHDTGDSDSKGNNAISIYAFPGYSTSAIVRYNLVYHNRSTGITVNGSDGHVTASVYYNIIFENNQWADAILPSQLKVYGTDSNDFVTIYNNVVCGGNQTGIMFEGDPVIFNIVAKNNISAFNKSYDLEIRGNATNLTLDYNCYFKPSGNIIFFNGNIYSMLDYRNYQDSESQDAKSIFKDPLFVNDLGYNFELSSGSPCVDTGTDAKLQRDFNGINIPQGRWIDIGAFEHKKISTPKNLNVIPLQ